MILALVDESLPARELQGSAAATDVDLAQEVGKNALGEIPVHAAPPVALAP